MSLLVHLNPVLEQLKHLKQVLPHSVSLSTTQKVHKHLLLKQTDLFMTTEITHFSKFVINFCLLYLKVLKYVLRFVCRWLLYQLQLVLLC